MNEVDPLGFKCRYPKVYSGHFGVGTSISDIDTLQQKIQRARQTFVGWVGYEAPSRETTHQDDWLGAIFKLPP